MYQILFKDIPVFNYELQNGFVQILNKKLMPFDIYLEEADDFDTRIQNNVNFYAWCVERILPLDREYIKEILNYYGFDQAVSDKERSKIAIACRCLSLNDCFWLKTVDENISWKDVNLFNNSLTNGVFEIALFGKSFTITNKELSTSDLTTSGKAPKAWQRTEEGTYLLKGDKNDSVLKETEASQILSALGIENVGYTKELFHNKPISKCKCFTNESIHFVKAQWFEIWCMNHDMSIIDYIEDNRMQFDRMNLADYLIGNNDEHSQNWGFIYNDDMEILSINPLMDYDHAFESHITSDCLPAKYVCLPGKRITQLDMAIEVVKKHPDWLRTDIDLSGYKYGSFVKERIDILKKELGIKKAGGESGDDGNATFNLDGDELSDDDGFGM